MAKLRNTLSLLRMCWGILRDERGLLVFPIVSALTIGMIGILALVGAAAASGGSERTAAEGTHPAVAVASIAFVVAARVVATFFTGALVAGALERLQGRDPTVGAALATAGRHAPALIGFGILSSLVDLITMAVRDERSGNLLLAIVQSIIAALISAAWAFATFLAVPAIIAEHAGALGGMRRSMELVRTTWGERLVGESALGLLLFLIAIGLMVVALVVAVAVPVLTPIVAVVLIASLVVLGVVVSALGQVYRAALYLYAVGETRPAGFDDATLRGALQPRPV